MPHPSIKDLPPDIIKKLEERLIAGQASRTVSEWLSQQGHRFSHKAVNRYNQTVVKPALKIGIQIQQQQAVENKQDMTTVEQGNAVREVTKAVLDAAPILARADWMWSEVEQGVADSKGEKPDLKGRAAMLGVGTRIIEVQAKALQLPGFVPGQQPATTTNNILVVMPRQVDERQPAQIEPPTIDVEPL